MKRWIGWTALVVVGVGAYVAYNTVGGRMTAPLIATDEAALAAMQAEVDAQNETALQNLREKALKFRRPTRSETSTSAIRMFTQTCPLTPTSLATDLIPTLPTASPRVKAQNCEPASGSSSRGLWILWLCQTMPKASGCMKPVPGKT